MGNGESRDREKGRGEDESTPGEKVWGRQMWGGGRAE